MAHLESTKLMNLSKPKFVNKLGKIGNNTYCRYDPTTNTAAIFLHGSLIATLQYGDSDNPNAPFMIVYITDAGYGTPTTRDRINQIMHDNGIPYIASQKNYEQILVRVGEYTVNHWQDAGTGKRYIRFVKFEQSGDWYKAEL